MRSADERPLRAWPTDFGDQHWSVRLGRRKRMDGMDVRFEALATLPAACVRHVGPYEAVGPSFEANTPTSGTGYPPTHG